MAGRSETVKLRVSDVELASFKAAAGEAGMSLSEWLRFLANSAVENYKMDGLALVNNAIGLLNEPDAPPMSKRAGWAAVAPLDRMIVDVSPAAPLSAGPLSRNVRVASKPLKAEDITEPRFGSEKPRAGRRTMLCAHRVPVGSYCSRCD